MAKRTGHMKVGARLANFGDRMPIVRSIRSKRTRKSNVLRGLGVILFWVSIILAIPLGIALYCNEDPLPFLVTLTITFILSLVLVTTYGSSKTYHHTDGMLLVIFLWIALFVVGMIPYVVADLRGDIHCSVVNALFESVSGFTTVGASIFQHVQDLPESLMFWRVLTQWIGGIIIVLLFMVILPLFISGRRGLASNDVDMEPLTDADGVQMRMIDVAKQFVLVYVGLTAIFSVILWISGEVYGNALRQSDNSINIAMSTISIGGFSFWDDSLANHINDVQKIIIALMMIISATNFYLHFRRIVRKELSIYSKDTEFKVMIIWYAILTLLIVILLGNRFIDGFFMLVSMATTTGFVTDGDFGNWGSAILVLLAIAMFVGGSSGSPAGGIKVSRLIIIVKSIIIDAYEAFNPTVVQVPKVNGRAVNEKRIRNAYAVFILFVMVCGLTAIVYSVWGDLEIDEAIFTSVSLVTCTGTTIGTIASSSYDCLPDIVKLFTCFVMVFARMEVIALLTIFMPKFWTDVAKNTQERMNKGEPLVVNKSKLLSKK